MKIKEIMSKHPEIVLKNTTIGEAAKKMQKLGCGFLPVGDKEKDKLIGAITDRDIVIQGIAKNKDINKTAVKDIMTEKVIYCFEDDTVESTLESMEKQQVRRLVVLNKNKRLVGIVSLGDIATHIHNRRLSGEAIEKVSENRKAA